MIQCPYCGEFNNPLESTCRKCREPLPSAQRPRTQAKRYGPDQVRTLRDRALSLIVLGLLIKVYWGGYGPWPVVDNPTLATIRTWAEPLMLYGGGLLYATGWVLSFV